MTFYFLSSEHNKLEAMIIKNSNIFMTFNGVYARCYWYNASAYKLEHKLFKYRLCFLIVKVSVHLSRTFLNVSPFGNFLV